MKPRKTPPTRGLVAVVWHGLLCLLSSFCIFEKAKRGFSYVIWFGPNHSTGRITTNTFLFCFLVFSESNVEASMLIPIESPPKNGEIKTGDITTRGPMLLKLPMQTRKDDVSDLIEFIPAGKIDRPQVPHSGPNDAGIVIAEKTEDRVKHVVIELMIGIAVGAVFGHFRPLRLISSFLHNADVDASADDKLQPKQTNV